jgi:hypothetical protein
MSGYWVDITAVGFFCSSRSHELSSWRGGEFFRIGYTLRCRVLAG